MNNIKKRETIKSLNTRFSKLESEILLLRSEVTEANKKLHKKNNQLKEISEKIERYNLNPEVSEHAVLRYLERKFNLDMNDIKKQIMNDKLEKVIKTIGDGKYPIGDGMTAIVTNKTVVTVI